jgi:hypothetical protein
MHLPPAHRFVHVGFAFVGLPRILDLQPIFTGIGDWIRYSPLCWIVWTDKPLSEIAALLKMSIDTNDQVLVAEIQVPNVTGYLSPWIWQWMNAKQLSSSATNPLLQAQSPTGY